MCVCVCVSQFWRMPTKSVNFAVMYWHERMISARNFNFRMSNRYRSWLHCKIQTSISFFCPTIYSAEVNGVLVCLFIWYFVIIVYAIALSQVFSTAQTITYCVRTTNKWYTKKCKFIRLLDVLHQASKCVFINLFGRLAAESNLNLSSAFKGCFWMNSSAKLEPIFFCKMRFFVVFIKKCQLQNAWSGHSR